MQGVRDERDASALGRTENDDACVRRANKRETKKKYMKKKKEQLSQGRFITVSVRTAASVRRTTSGDAWEHGEYLDCFVATGQSDRATVYGGRRAIAASVSQD